MAETIFAPATARGRAGIAVLRISGRSAGAALRALTAPQPLPPPRAAVLRTVREPGSGEILDRGLALWFPAPMSFTGEDVVELHLHGGRAVVDSVVRALGALPDLRLAEPGEFTRRAFENGKLDLTAAEAVADLVDAETRAQQRQALRQLDGVLGRLYEGWRARLVRALAHLEADLDFPDEDLPAGVAGQVVPTLEVLRQEIEAHLDDKRRGERLREGISIAILGPPNAGKSSLLNVLAQREAAIVSARAGTTRDVIEVHLDLGGYPVVLADTAGLREARSAVEDEGVRRARQRAAAADLRLVVVDVRTWPGAAPSLAEFLDGDAMLVLNKADLVDPVGIPTGTVQALVVSARTGQGIAALVEAVAQRVGQRFEAAGAPALTRPRHRETLEACSASLARAALAPLPELAAEDVRLAVRSLARITGKVDVEDLLDIIFRDFCIGK